MYNTVIGKIKKKHNFHAVLCDVCNFTPTFLSKVNGKVSSREIISFAEWKRRKHIYYNEKRWTLLYTLQSCPVLRSRNDEKWNKKAKVKWRKLLLEDKDPGSSWTTMAYSDVFTAGGGRRYWGSILHPRSFFLKLFSIPRKYILFRVSVTYTRFLYLRSVRGLC